MFHCTKMHNESQGKFAQAFCLFLDHAALHLRVDLRGLDAFVPQHLTHNLYGNPMVMVVAKVWRPVCVDTFFLIPHISARGLSIFR